MDNPIDPIPRRHGTFLWKQIVLAKELGVSMLNATMFDEVDEGTAIYKCVNDPPACPNTDTKFLDYEGLPSDYYLWLSGQAKRVLSGELPPTESIPERR